jgi:diguanylate cyclase (GGDEF)-like protein/PAS domain S-box-containing protein
MPSLSKIRYFWLVPIVFWSLMVGLSFRSNWQALQRQVLEITTTQGRDIFRMIEAVRLWNARHGSVYVIQSELSPPNPYLDVPERDPVTISGKRLTMVNPAYMTRQVADTILEQTGFRVHITSLNPINPGNRADPWETEALKSFEHGVRERAEIIKDPLRQVRYMAPLVVQQPCLVCHEKQGYKVGDIRGGISVSFSALPTEESIAPHRRDLIAGHALALVLLSALSIYALRRLRSHTESLEDARQEQEQLVELRTAELRREAVERRQAESQLRHLVTASSNGMFGVDARGYCVFCNPTASRLLDVAESDSLIGSDILALFDRSNPELATRMRRCLQGETVHEENVVFKGEDGNVFPIELRLDPISADGEPSGAVASFSDITERQNKQLEVWRQANFDHLTGLPNRQLFRDRFERALVNESRNGGSLALLFIDLDKFKPVNDTFGHGVGDAVLVEVGRRILANVRESDIAARLGGDEFVVVLTESGDQSNVAGAVRKLLHSLARPYIIGKWQADVSATIGVALFPEDGQEADGLLKSADRAMYAAKEAGRRRCHFCNGTVVQIEN